LANGARGRLDLEVLPEDFIELVDPIDVEEIELHEHYVRVAATRSTQKRTQVSQGLMRLFIKCWQHLARFL